MSSHATSSFQPTKQANTSKTGWCSFLVGAKPHAANLVKLSGNLLITSVIESLGETMALVGKAGIDQRQYLDVLTSTLFAAPVYKTYGGLIAEEKFEPAGFAARLGHKDIRLSLAAAEGLRVPMPLASLLHDRFLTLLAQGATTIIHDTPKRSATMPKRGEKNVLVNGCCTCPPSASAVNSRSASAS